MVSSNQPLRRAQQAAQHLMAAAQLGPMVACGAPTGSSFWLEPLETNRKTRRIMKNELLLFFLGFQFPPKTIF